MIASTSRFSAKETIDTVPTSRYALRTPLASATWSLASNQPHRADEYPRSGWAACAFADSVG